MCIHILFPSHVWSIAQQATCRVALLCSMLWCASAAVSRTNVPPACTALHSTAQVMCCKSFSPLPSIPSIPSISMSSVRTRFACSPARTHALPPMMPLDYRYGDNSRPSPSAKSENTNGQRKTDEQVLRCIRIGVVIRCLTSSTISTFQHHPHIPSSALGKHYFPSRSHQYPILKQVKPRKYTHIKASPAQLGCKAAKAVGPKQRPDSPQNEASTAKKRKLHAPSHASYHVPCQVNKHYVPRLSRRMLPSQFANFNADSMQGFDKRNFERVYNWIQIPAWSWKISALWAQGDLE
ncbi:hypothetical protein P171DRAFT_146852 [Karstenula rhodostoma CBS 690.94]|uniref:Secreted protein n=1 Tax=Karstenula rhodostoma CBS 690.94 TaxID=1392251 RepID=A0A9P4PV58_9PLEO|nr:hypothetical protein P171DRAFT_146852 [Karstenula rhodostoma CBS 690.94]